jgi:hypothetical protein
MRLILLGTVLLIVLFALVPFGVFAVDTSTETNAADVTVKAVSLDPGVFMPDEIGTVTVDVQNTGARSVAIRRVTLYDQDITLESSPYDTTQYLGPGNTMQYTFTVTASSDPGIYYPVFSLNFRDIGSLRYPVKLEVEESVPIVAVLSRPDTFAAGRKDEVKIRVANPRDNAISSVSLVPEGTGFTVTPTSAFLGTIPPDGMAEATFAITPDDGATVAFRLTYKNGPNPHELTVPLSLNFGERKTQALPVTSNIMVTNEKDFIRVTGDVTNAGLETASGVVMSVGAPAVPRDPYRQYVVGALKPDDISSFELTFSTEGQAEVPLMVLYKDEDGNVYTNRVTLAIGADLQSAGSEGSAPPVWPVVVVIVALAAVIVGVIAYTWLKRGQSRA